MATASVPSRLAPLDTARASSEHMYTTLQVTALRDVGFSQALLIAAGALVMASDSWAHAATRVLLASVCALLALATTHRTVRPASILLASVVVASPIVRGLYMDHAEVVFWMVIIASHRCMPILTAIINGRVVCVLFSLVSCLAPYSVVSVLRYRAGLVSLAGVFSLSAAHLTDVERRLLATDIYYQVVATFVAVFTQRAIRTCVDYLNDALAAKQQFITNMNHEIRTPLVGVISMTDLLLVHPHVPRDIAECLLIIQSSGRALLAIVNNILDMSKLATGNILAAAHAAVNLRDAATRTVNTFAALAVSKSVAYSLTIDPALPSLLLTDEIRVQQVLGNLIGNAFKFTSHGGVHVSVGYAANGVRDLEDLLHPQPFEQGAASPAGMACFHAGASDLRPAAPSLLWQATLHLTASVARGLGLAHRFPPPAARLHVNDAQRERYVVMIRRREGRFEDLRGPN